MDTEKIEIAGKKIPKYLLLEYAKHIARRYVADRKNIRPDLGDIYVFEKSRDSIHNSILRFAGIKTSEVGGIFRCPEPECRKDYEVFEKALKKWTDDFVLGKIN